MTITQYLGTGAQSRGRLTINKLLNMQATTAPYLHNDADKAAVIAGLEKVQGYFKSISNLTWIRPAPNETATHYVNSVSSSGIPEPSHFYEPPGYPSPPPGC